MLSFNVLITICLAYVILLFAVAFWADKRAEGGRLGWLRAPIVYTLSLSIYCTAWTFYGAVGYAARSGLEFVTIYLGPTLVMLAWQGHAQRAGQALQAQRRSPGAAGGLISRCWRGLVPGIGRQRENQWGGRTRPPDSGRPGSLRSLAQT